jgi:hypothetical protein
MIAFACAMLLASNCHAALTPVEPVGYVVRAQGLNAQAALAEINAFCRSHGLKPVTALDPGCRHLGAVSSEPRQNMPPWPRRVETVGSGKKRRLRPPPYRGERGLGAKILRRGDARLGAEPRAQAPSPAARRGGRRRCCQLSQRPGLLHARPWRRVTGAPLAPLARGRGGLPPFALQRPHAIDRHGCVTVRLGERHEGSPGRA